MAFLSAFVSLSAADTGSADKSKKAVKKKNIQVEEHTITSQHLDYDHVNHTAIFRRNVKAINGNTTIISKKMTAFFDKDNKPYLIIAEGDVVITRLKQKAFAQKAIYKMAEHTILLKYKPSLVDGKNLIKGRVIIFHEDSGICEVDDPVVTLYNEKKKIDKKVEPAKK